MILNTPCQHCQQPIEFDDAQINQFVACPACAKQTRLLAVSTPASRREPELDPCPDCGEYISYSALLCPKCGRFCGVTFMMVFQVVCLVTVSYVVLTALGILCKMALAGI